MIKELLEILKYVLPSIVVLLTAFMVIRSFLQNEQKKLDHQNRMNNGKKLLPLRLTAYERLVVFLERITPSSLVPRVVKAGMSAKVMQQALIANIKSEFEHNFSQQIYVSPRAWNAVSLVKDQMIKDINLLCANMPDEATAVDLSRRILQYYAESSEAGPTRNVLEMLKAEVRKLY